MALLLAGMVASSTETMPIYGGIVDDWREGFVEVGSLSSKTTVAKSIRTARQVMYLPDGFALLHERTVTVYRGSGTSKRTDGRYQDAIFAGRIGSEPVLRTAGGVLLLASSGNRALRSGAIGSEACAFQAGGSPVFVTRQSGAPEFWQCEASFGKKPIVWRTKKGSLVDQTIIGQGLLVSSEVTGARRVGELSLFRFGRRPSKLLRRSNTRVLMGQGQPQSPLWISVARYRRPADHVASSSEISELLPSGRLSRRFSVPFEFRPSGLDESRKWLLGIRMRGLHAGASELVAIRLKDGAVKTLRSHCQLYIGLSR